MLLPATASARRAGEPDGRPGSASRKASSYAAIARGHPSWAASADAAATAADDVRRASQTLETQSQHLGNQVTEFLGKIRAA